MDDKLKTAPLTDAELETALAQLAEDVPPMPADFHDRWMRAVRQEALGTGETREEPARKRGGIPVRLTRILSAAAAFIFLIGGTMLYRSGKRSLSQPAAVEREAQEDFEQETEEAAAFDEAGAALSMKAAGSVQDSAVYAENAAEIAWEADAAEADEGESSFYATEAATAAYGADTAVSDAEFAASDAEPAAYGVETEADTAIDDAAAPEENDAEQAEPAVAPAAPAETPGTGIGAFFSDMGDFLLAALPYLLVLAVPAAAALIIRRKKERGT